MGFAGNRVNLGPAPWDEDCVQVGEPGYSQKAKAECNRYIAQLRKQFGPEPEGVTYSVEKFSHDFGSYYEVVLIFDGDNNEAVSYALTVEGDLPGKWLE